MIAVLRAIAMALLCLSTPIGAVVQDAASAGAPTTVVQTPGYRLAMLTNPLHCFDIQPGSAPANEMTRLLEADPTNQEIEAEYPGFIAYAATVVLSRTQANRHRLAAETWRALAPMFDDGMTALQLSQANSFFATEAGQRLVSDVCANMDVRGIGEAMAASGDYSISADAIERSQRSAAETTAMGVAAYSARDRAAIQWFTQTEASRAMLALRPRMFAIIAEVGNRPDPEFDAAIERDIDRFFERAAKGSRPARAPDQK